MRGATGVARWSEKSIGRNLIGWISKATDLEWFDNLFDFYVTSTMETRMPKEFYRDYDKLVDVWNRADRFIERVAELGYEDQWLDIDILCAWLNVDEDSWCFKSFKKKSPEIKAWVAISEVYKNNQLVKWMFRRSALGWENKIENSSQLMFTDVSREEFRTMLNRYYGANAFAECSSCDWFNYEISRRIEQIGATLKRQKKASNVWVDAWYTLIGHESVDIAQRERILLERELSRQWLPAEAADTMVQNLEKYNENGWGFSLWNNAISNTFRSIRNTLWEFSEDYSFAVDSEFERQIENGADPEKVTTSIEQLQDVVAKTDTSSRTAREIKELYLIQYNLAQSDDLAVDLFSKEIIKSYNSFTDATAILKDTVTLSEEVCNTQWANINVQCSYWNHK